MPSSGPQIDRYEIVRQVGRDSVATVYLARQRTLQREVALKELSRSYVGTADVAARFLRESRLAGSLNHPNIVTVFDYFEHEGLPYIAMEYLGRGSLRPYIGHLSLPQFAGVMEGVLAAMAYADARGIVHGDLKPENILVTGDGRVKVADFGLVSAISHASSDTVTTGAILGTPSYMAPEQPMGLEVGVWTDLYSVGVIAWEQLVGRTPFSDSDVPMVILVRQVNETIPSAAAVSASADPKVSDWIDRLLVKDPRDRQRSPVAAWQELEDIVVDQLGPLWRREARLPAPSEVLDTPLPLTPAPFETERPIPWFRTPSAIDALLSEAVRRGVVPAGVSSRAGQSVAVSPAAQTRPSRSVEYPANVAAAPAPAPVEAEEPPADAFRSADRMDSARPKRKAWVRLAISIPAAAVAVAVVAELLKRVFGWFELPAEPRGPEGQANRRGDIVDCTVFAPPSAVAGEPILVQVFAHLADQTEDARALATEFDPSARRRVFQCLHSVVPRGARLAFELRIRGVTIDEPVQTLVWQGRAESVQFEAVLPNDRTSGALIGTVLVSLDGAPIGHVKFRLEVASAPASDRQEPVGELAARYRSAFVSYASADRDQVLTRLPMLSAVNINYFNDLLNLEPGERWWPRLQAAIDECDVFLLFWSSNARSSVSVRREVEHALHRQAGNELSPPEIRPVIIEGPPPVPPWDELNHLHFNDRVLYFLSPTTSGAADSAS